MKQISLMLILILIFYCTSKADFRGFRVDARENTPGRIDETPLHYFREAMDYVEGGITFTYPLDFFSEPPIVLLSVEYKNLVYSVTEAVVPVVTANSASATSVRANIINDVLNVLDPIVLEVPTDDITICLDALGTFTVS